MARTKTAVSKAENDSKAQEKPVKKERKPRAPTAYNNFVKNFYATYEVEDGEEKPKPKEMISMAAAAWKELTDDEKAEYKTVSTEITIEIKKEKPKKKAESEDKPKKGKGGKGLRKGKPASDDEAEAEEEDEE